MLCLSLASSPSVRRLIVEGTDWWYPAQSIHYIVAYLCRGVECLRARYVVHDQCSECALKVGLIDWLSQERQSKAHLNAANIQYIRGSVHQIGVSDIMFMQL